MVEPVQELGSTAHKMVVLAGGAPQWEKPCLCRHQKSQQGQEEGGDRVEYQSYEVHILLQQPVGLVGEVESYWICDGKRENQREEVQEHSIPDPGVYKL